MSDYETDSSFLDPDLGKRPVLAAGDYGADGSAVLDRYDLVDSRMAQGLKADRFSIAIKTEEHGVVRVFADPPRRQGTQAVRWFRQLGLDDDTLRQLPGGEAGAAEVKARIEGTPVIVTLGVREYEDKNLGEMVAINTVKNIVKLGGQEG